MTNESFDRDSWERRWEQALREHPDALASRPPNAHLLAEIGDGDGEERDDEEPRDHERKITVHTPTRHARQWLPAL